MIKKISYILLVFCIFFANMYVPLAKEQTLGELKIELANYKQEYEDNKLQEELTEQEKINTLNRIEEINERVYEIGIEIQALVAEIEQLNIEIENSEQEIADILQFVQVQNGESAYLEYAFGAQSFTDFIYRIAISEQVTTYNDELIDAYRQNIEENKQKSAELDTKKDELSDEQSQLQVELQKIETELSLIDEYALSIEELIEAKEQEIKAYTDLGCRDDQTLTACLVEKNGADVSFWRPVEKSVVTSFYGPRVSTSWEVSSYHNGIDVADGGLVPVYPAANGVVVYITNYSYATCSPKRIHIQHTVNGKIYTTGYLHMSTLNVSVGDIVAKTDVIGLMGGDESNDTCSTGQHLHFEISTGTFASGNYYSNRYDPKNTIDFPDSKYVYFYTRY